MVKAGAPALTTLAPSHQLAIVALAAAIVASLFWLRRKLLPPSDSVEEVFQLTAVHSEFLQRSGFDLPYPLTTHME